MSDTGRSFAFKSEAAIKFLELGIVGERDKSSVAFVGHSVHEGIDGKVTDTLISEFGRYRKSPEFDRLGVDIELFHAAYDNSINFRYVKTRRAVKNILQVAWF